MRVHTWSSGLSKTLARGARSGVLLLVAFAALAGGCVQPPRSTRDSGSPTALPKDPKPAGLAHTNEPVRFVVTFPATARSNAVTGRVLLFVSRKTGGEPRQTSSFSSDPPQLSAIDTTNWVPGTPLIFWPSNFNAPNALTYPGPLSRLEAGPYRVQALIDLHTTHRDFNAGPGNLYSKIVPCQLHGSRGGAIELVADQVITEKPPRDNAWVKLVEVRSPLLSEFHRRDTFLRAAVILPSTYTNNTDTRFPTVYLIPGFGGRHTSAWSWIDSGGGKKWQQGEVPLQALRVVLDPDVPLGHSVFANSANNGPVGDALVQELIPEIERRFRAIAHPTARFVTGHSSGGWASLWLQVAYPDFFGGCWSTAPDPVDFRAFQTLNIYEDRNAHWTREGFPRPISRSRDRVGLTFQHFNQVEYVLGPGGQLDSFEGVFSPRAPDGQPRRLMDKISGHIDREVAEYWKRYDIRLLLEQNWATLGPKLQNKLHVIAAGWDTYYLDPAVVLLRDFLRGKSHGGYVEIHPGDHGSVMTEALRERLSREMAEQFRATAGVRAQPPALGGAGPISVVSPDGRIEWRSAVEPSSTSEPGWRFDLRFRGKPLLQAGLGLRFRGEHLLTKPSAESSRTRVLDTTYAQPLGKNNPVRDRCNELTFDAEVGAPAVGKAHLVVRVYDDAVAFRYVIPEQAGLSEIEIADEPGWFRFEGDPRTWPLLLENYTTSHEGIYASTSLSQLATNRLIDLPLLVEYDDGPAVAITEANLRNYAGMYLKVQDDAGGRRLRCDLSPLPGKPGVKVRSRLPVASPWRVILVGDSPGRLIESNVILNLNEPNTLGDASWLKAGKTTWYWWNGPYQEPVEFKVGFNWETMKHYIDFCARNNIAFHSVISTEDEYPWYHQTRHGYQPGPDSDVTRARGDFPMQRITDYARSQGVGIRLWVHWKPLHEQLEAAFAQYEKWGIAGLMVDFLDRDDQEMTLWAERVLQVAARHHLHVQFHGMAKPTGLERTYPNLFNHEGVLNLEYLKWGDQCTPEHNVTVPFTRMLAGPLDYHLGGFRSVNREQFKAVMEKPSVLGTRCHHLAMYVVYENPMPMVSDAPTAYEGQPGFDFLRQVPSTWDETRVLNGRVGDYIVLARRQRDAWYVGAMTDWTPRELEVPLSFLPPGRYQVELWADVPGATDPNQLSYRKQTMSAGERLGLRLNSGGGMAACIRPAP